MWAEGERDKEKDLVGLSFGYSDFQILECGFRELWEECGLQLPKKEFSCVLLGLWEVRQNDPPPKPIE